MIEEKILERFNLNNETIQQVVKHLGLIIWSYDSSEHRMKISKGIEKLLHGSVQEIESNFKKWIHKEDYDFVLSFKRKLMSGNSASVIHRCVKANGETVWLEVHGVPNDKDDGQPTGISGFLVDITEKKTMEENLQKSESEFQQLMDLSTEPMVIQRNNEIIYMNPASLKMLGATSLNEVVGRSVSEFNHPLYDSKFQNDKKSIGDEANLNFSERKLITLDGREIDIESFTVSIHYDGKPSVLNIGKDITTRKKTEEKMKYMAYYDELTDLPNRRRFLEHLDVTLERAKQSQQELTVICLDLDRFKLINDTLGHEIGDELLRRTANRLKSLNDYTSIISRPGGDEFLLIIENSTEAKCEEIAQSIIHMLSIPFDIRGNEIFMTPSIGISMYPKDGTDVGSLMKYADAATSLAKEKGTNQFQFFDKKISEQLERKLWLEKEIRKALIRGQFYLVYQPKFRLGSTQMITGVEALIRWEHPEIGLISPGEFIPIAEETGLIVDIGEWVIREACKEVKKWNEKHQISVAVNLSVRQLQHRNQIIEQVKKALEEVDFPPHLLELEVTESIMQKRDEAVNLLKELKELGIQLSLDDFGTGYSSLSYLKRFPLDTLKIDQSFVRDLIRDQKDQAIVKSMVEIGRNLNMKVIAEGIETLEQLEALQNLECYEGQGFFLGRPLPAIEFVNTVLNPITSK